MMPATAFYPAATQAPTLDLDARLAIVGAAMTLRLDEAAVAFEVNTAHIPTEPVPATAVPVLAPLPCPYATPVAALLYRARVRLEAGWCTGRLRDEQGAVCLIGAIRAEAPTAAAAHDTCALLLEVIRRSFPTAESVPSWNDAQHGPRLPLLMLDRATSLADARGL